MLAFPQENHTASDLDFLASKKLVSMSKKHLDSALSQQFESAHFWEAECRRAKPFQWRKKILHRYAIKRVANVNRLLGNVPNTTGERRVHGAKEEISGSSYKEFFSSHLITTIE